MRFIEKIGECKKCEIRLHKPLVFGDIENNKFVFLSEEPTRDARDNDFYEYYLGTRNERFHKEWLHELGINEAWLKNNVYITHVYKCFSELKKPERDKKCAQCLNWLEKEKEYFKKGKTIITFGAYAFANLFLVHPYAIGITQIVKEKKVFQFGESKIIPLLHPSGRNIYIDKFRDEIECTLNKIRNLMHSQVSK